MDRLDKKILAVLQADARASLQEIGQAVGLSPSPCWGRIKKMEEAGEHPEYSHTFTLHSGSADAKCYSVGFDCRDVDSVRHITRYSLVADKNT